MCFSWSLDFFFSAGVDDMEAIGNASDRHLFLQFFNHLGIEDEVQLVFLSTMLRNVFDTTSKLDRHLAKYGASLHYAVSRMVVSKNPREAPSHRWIRVLDRLGFFTDGDKHAERIVNIGMSFAYRQLEVDALADANTVLLRQTAPSTTTNNGGGGNGGDLPANGAAGSGAVGGKTGVADKDLPGEVDDDLGDAEDPALPVGGLVFTSDDTPSAGVGGDGGGDGGEPRLPPGGMIVSDTATGELPSAGGTQGSNPLAGAGGMGQSAATGGQTHSSLAEGAGPGGDQDVPRGDVDADDDGGAGPVPSHVVCERQPTVLPPASAVAVVASVIRSVASRSGGPEVMRKLFDDSVLCVARTGPPTPSQRGAVCPTGSKADWAAVSRMCTSWWPQWIATPDVPTLPPVGTVSRRLFKSRLALTSRWAVSVDMQAINATLDETSVRSSRFFPKTKLAAVEEVVRISAKIAMRLPVVVAAMLLFCTKEERFSGILMELAAVGRVNVNKAAPLHAASLHEFASDGLAPASALSSQGTAPPHLRPPDQRAVAAAVLQSGDEVDMEEKYADMDVALQQEDVAVAALNRADRMQKMRASQAAQAQAANAAARPSPAATAAGGTGGVLPAAAARTASLPSLLRAGPTPPPNAAPTSASQRSGASAGRPPRGVKRGRTPRVPRGAAAKAAAVKAASAAAAAAAAVGLGAAARTGAAIAASDGTSAGREEVTEAVHDGAAVAAGAPSVQSPLIPSAMAHAGAAPQPEPGISQPVAARGGTPQTSTLQHVFPPGAVPFDPPGTLPAFSPSSTALHSPVLAGMVGGGAAVASLEGGASMEHASAPSPLTFAEQSRARHARVEADLRDANASLQHILQRQEARRDGKQ